MKHIYLVGQYISHDHRVLGVFSTQSLARAEVNRVISHRGLKGYPKDFERSRDTLDNTLWLKREVGRLDCFLYIKRVKIDDGSI